VCVTSEGTVSNQP